MSIRAKLIIAFAGLSVIPVGLLGLHGVFSNAKMMKQIAFENLTHDVRTIREKTANFLTGVESDLRLLQSASFVQRFLTAAEGPAKQPKERTTEQLASELLAFARTKQIYYQIRIIDDAGDELLRIECLNLSDSLLSFSSTPASELRQGFESYYILLAEGLTKGEIAFTPAEVVHGSAERVPVIGFVMPLFGSKGRVGLLIANVFAKNLFRVIETQRHLNLQGKIVLATSDGHYLYHSEKKKDWNKLLASREDENLQHDYSPSIVAQLLSRQEGMIDEGIDEIISYGPLFSPRGTLFTHQPHAFSNPFFVFESLPKEIVLGPVWTFSWTFAGFLMVFLITSVGLGLLATRQFTKPIAMLQQGAEVITKGNYGHRLHVETHDEIEELAQQFNVMAGSLEVHEREILRHRTTLQEMVQNRTRELTEEKAKLQALLDNVPSAVVLLDQQFRIQAASAAFSNVTGFRFEDARGQDCQSVFCKDGFCRECVSRQAMLSGNTEIHVDQTFDRVRAERYIEHVAIPLKENGHVSSILEIITDITKRKQLEQRLLQTERLTAAGEMSALIAHEFRNSLTSVKMILQLQRESKNFFSHEKKSLDVALNSIHHMEGVVTELLNFARPSPMEFRPEQLLDVINDSISFIESHLKKNIQIEKSLRDDLPSIELDAPHFKEAMINILLNAAQAIENKPRMKRKEIVSVRTHTTTLGKELRDFTLRDNIGDAPDKDGVRSGREITLKKGTRCILVEVSDSGPGIPRNLLNRIFDPFFTTKSNGTGLGLPMVKQTVNAHGGIVTVESRRGAHATFRIYLPLGKRETTHA
ncbi:MAG: PAS domain-containing protein [Ignavibacteriales bacterium]|nr:PAS domain-containing protein [Ignavibacteriales bacterium]